MLRDHPFILAGIFLLSFLQICGQERQRVQFYYNIAEGNYLIGDLRGAERGIEQSLRLDPAHAPSLALQAKILMDQSKPESALAAAEEAVRSAPGVVEYQLLRALILGRLNRRAEAIIRIDEMLANAEPDSEDALTAQQLKGLLKMAEANWDEAAEAFKKTYEAAPDASGTGRKLAAEAYMEKARSSPSLEQALKAVDQAMALYSETTGRDNLDALEQLKLARAQLQAGGGQTAQAIAALQSIVGQNPNNLQATIILASLYADQENWAALEDLIAPIARNPLLADVALYLEGRVALSRDRVGTARTKFEQALELNMKRPSSLKYSLEFYRSICFARLKRFEDAEKSLRAALAGDYVPETPDEALHLGQTLIRIGDVDTLIPTLGKALLQGNDSAEAWAILGRAHIEKQQNTLAISALNQSLALDPEQVETLALRGSLLRKLGDYEGALVDYERAHSKIPSSPALSYERGLVLMQLGQLNEAESFLRVAARKLTTHVTLDLLHASSAYAIGNFVESSRSLQEFLNPELSSDALKSFEANLPETAFYLHMLLSRKAEVELPDLAPPNEAARLFKAYANRKATRKQVLDWAGRAESPVQARAQICAVAYWLAQLEQSRGNDARSRELLDIALEAGNRQNPEWQFTKWTLKKMNKADP
ncbi:MAG: tetratricopeptide repeat protein [Opitutales bacterium]